ncbi:MAG: NADH-quinone oxidoreductase subunit C [Armatimonadota bacterium]|nr:MAG: NADH-quinone oxidoreductase subunit C [Armatimonadota bacterium]
MRGSGAEGVSDKRESVAPAPESLTARCPALETAHREDRELLLRCRPEGLPDLCVALRDEHGFDYLADLCGADCPELRVVIRLYSTIRKDYCRISVPLDRAIPVCPSLTPLWPAANWQEREAYDLFGIRFEGHPDLRRILLPADWEGHPLLRDREQQPEATS